MGCQWDIRRSWLAALGKLCFPHNRSSHGCYYLMLTLLKMAVMPGAVAAILWPWGKGQRIRVAGSGSLIVGSGCCNKGPSSGWLLNTRNLFCIVLKAGCLSSGCQHGPVLLTALIQATDCWLLIVTSHGGKEKLLLVWHTVSQVSVAYTWMLSNWDSTWYYIIWDRWVGKIF